LLPDASRRQQRAADAPLVAGAKRLTISGIQQSSASGLAADPQRVNSVSTTKVNQNSFKGSYATRTF